MKLWKVFRADLKSNNGNIKWKLGKWQRHKGNLIMCSTGFHASERIIDAMQYINAELIARVEAKGKSLKQDDKQVWEYMRLLEVYEWKKEDSVSLAIFVAELVLPNFEKEFPDDKRPREAIEAAKKVLLDDSEKNRSATESAAESAAGSAWSAESAAESAAWSAARSAESAAKKNILDKCEKFILKRIKTKGVGKV